MIAMADSSELQLHVEHEAVLRQDVRQDVRQLMGAAVITRRVKSNKVALVDTKDAKTQMR